MESKQLSRTVLKINAICSKYGYGMQERLDYVKGVVQSASLEGKFSVFCCTSVSEINRMRNRISLLDFETLLKLVFDGCTISLVDARLERFKISWE